ncbi:MAG: M56 family metallopeptidase, partial [Clostridia bacterium]|nr:M56 family metallopeptidase [Clostridia bacterium]
MAELLTGLLVSTVSGTVLAALLFLAKPFVKGRISQKSQYYSWYLVFIRMLLPFSFGGIFIGNLIPFLQSRAAQTPANLASMGTVSAATSAIVPSVGAASALQSGALANAAQGNIFSVDYWYLFLFTVWLLGMIAILGFTIVSYIGYAFQIKSTRIQVKGETILALLKECCEEYNISEPLPLYVSSCTDTPMLCGL